jgi:hypothetical protein
LFTIFAVVSVGEKKTNFIDLISMNAILLFLISSGGRQRAYPRMQLFAAPLDYKGQRLGLYG